MFESNHPTFLGLKIISSPVLDEFQDVPVKKLKRKSWMSDSYFKRVQKKWAKRFGYKQIRPFYIASGNLFAHPSTVNIIKCEIDIMDTIK